MPRVATFCPRCGEAIETELPDEARALGRAQLTCPACKFRFVITPASRPAAEGPEAAPGADPAQVPPSAGASPTAPPPAAEAVASGGTVPEATGARIQGARPEGGTALPARLLAAGLLLVFAAALGFFLGGMFVFSDTLVEDAFSGPAGAGMLEGRVYDSGGRPLPNATVELLVETADRPDAATAAANATTTDADGYYAFEGLDPGLYHVRIGEEGHRTLILEAVAVSAEQAPPGGTARPFGEARLSAGSPQDIQYRSHVRTAATLMGWVVLVASAFAVTAAVLCFARRLFPLAVTGAAVGILSVGFLAGSVCAIIALIIILFSRSEFRGRSKRMPRRA